VAQASPPACPVPRRLVGRAGRQPVWLYCSDRKRANAKIKDLILRLLRKRSLILRYYGSTRREIRGYGGYGDTGRAGRDQCTISNGERYQVCPCFRCQPMAGQVSCCAEASTYPSIFPGNLRISHVELSVFYGELCKSSL
jgi:hypothetical protein